MQERTCTCTCEQTSQAVPEVFIGPYHKMAIKLYLWGLIRSLITVRGQDLGLLSFKSNFPETPHPFESNESRNFPPLIHGEQRLKTLPGHRDNSLHCLLHYLF